MNTQMKYLSTLFLALFLVSGIYAQTSELQYIREAGKSGINVFESPKTTDVEYEGFKVIVGGDFALQFQGLSQSSDNEALLANDLASNFNLPTANLNIDVQMEDGVRLHLRNYLSSRHHTESYVKGGYLQIDKLDFIQEGLAAGLMEKIRIRVGMDQFNYGDTQFRRSDNAAAIYNPFVGNYIMDSFTTEPFMEVTYMDNGIIGVIGATNGRLNQSPTDGDNGMVVFGKLGYDSQINQDLRVRLTGSFYNSTDKGTRDYLYHGNRAGGRYYAVMEGSDFSGTFDPGFAYQTAFQINPFVKYQGLEFFGVIETTSGTSNDQDGSFTQLGAELLYRFGANENFYIGGRYNSISGETVDDVSGTMEISRINLGGGWFMTENILAKLEYVSNTYDGAGFDGTVYEGGEFSGLMLEAVISF